MDLIEFEKYSNDSESKERLNQWNQDNKDILKKALIVFNEKTRNWYIAAYDGIGRRIEGRIDHIKYLKTLANLLKSIYSETPESDMPMILDKCQKRIHLISDTIKATLGIIKIMGGDDQINFKKLYEQGSLPNIIIDGYADGAYSIISAIKDSKFSTPEQMLKQSIAAIFLLRHTIELAIKELMICLGIEGDSIGHDLNRAWDLVQPELERKNLLNSKDQDMIIHTLNILEDWGLDESEEIFRYLKTNDGSNKMDDRSFNFHSLCERLLQTTLYFQQKINEISREKQRLSVLQNSSDIAGKILE